MKKLIFTLFLVLVCSFGFAQDKNEADSLIRILHTLPNDTNKVWVLEKIASIYGFSQLDLGNEYAQKGLDLALKLKFKKGEVMCLSRVGWMYNKKGNYTKSLEYQLKALKIAESIHYKQGIRKALGMINSAYRSVGYYDLALATNFQIIKLAKEMNDAISNAMRGTGETYLKMNRLDSALYYTQKAYDLAKKTNDINTIAFQIGNIYNKMGQYRTALKYLQPCAPYFLKSNNILYLAPTYNGIALAYQKLGKTDSCIYFAEKALTYAKDRKENQNINEASTILAFAYDTNDPIKALNYYKLANSSRDSINNTEELNQFQKLFLTEQRLKQEVVAERERYNNNLWRYGLILGLLFMGIIAFILFRNNKLKQRTNHHLQLQKDKVESTLSTLKSTQAQLIQSEKLASLGELTAGIAHEIQNPLNFVNNFSELSVDLVKDLKDEIEKPTQDKAYIGELFDDLSQNQEKINHHGKRASSIVKGMLEHSRASTGVRELTDINKLADEYLRLSYHGLRAKDKDFNADFTTDFDENLPRIEIIPQDIGRVLLNLINNAFYAVNQRKQLSKGLKPLESWDAYTPSVFVSTQQIDNQIIVKVKDNGIGMPESVRAKVFQPFFTTKPTGQGTGLGLSLAYDIITKGHGGTIECESVEGEGSQFIITLPMKTN